MKKYDFALTWDKNPCLFTRILKKAVMDRGLSYFWINEGNVRALTKQLEDGILRINILLDTEATYDVPGEPYARLCYAVKDAGGVVINDPDRTRMAVDKAVMHYELMDSGVETPYTVVVRNWEPAVFRLSEEEREKLEAPFIIKPGCGWGHRGVVYNARGTVREIAEARNFDRGDNFLLQEKILPMELAGKRAWFRVFHVFDKIIPCWWSDITSIYEHVSEREFKKFKLTPLVKMAARIGGISNMSWFSTEIAIDIKGTKIRFVAIDYVNDQCDMEARSESSDGVPDQIVRLTAYSMAHAAVRIIKHGRKRRGRYTVLLKKSRRKGIKGLGYAPDLLVQKQG